jgi:hypothetical protein
MTTAGRFCRSAVTAFFTVASCQPQVQKTGAARVWLSHSRIIISEIENLLLSNWSFRGLRREITTLNVFDFDHTLVDNTTLVPVTDDKGHSRTVDSKCLSHAANEKPDYGVFDRENTYAYRHVDAALQRLKGYVKDPKQSSVVLTARSDRRTFSMIQEYLWQRGAEPDAVFATNHTNFESRLWRQIRPEDAAKKPLLIAAILSHLRASGNSIKLVRYFEDTDKYLITIVGAATTRYL